MPLQRMAHSNEKNYGETNTILALQPCTTIRALRGTTSVRLCKTKPGKLQLKTGNHQGMLTHGVSFGGRSQQRARDSLGSGLKEYVRVVFVLQIFFNRSWQGRAFETLKGEVKLHRSIIGSH